MRVFQWPRALLVSFVILLTAGGLAACGGGSSGGDTLAKDASGHWKVRVAEVPSTGVLPFEVALKEGFFAKNGIDLDVTEGTDIQTWMAGLDRQYDVVMVTPAILFAAAGSGIKAEFISGLQQSTLAKPNQVLVTRNKVTDFKEMEGKTIGVPTLTGASAIAFEYLVKKAGGDPAKVKLTQLQYPMEPQFLAGKIDGIVDALPYWSTLKPDQASISDDVVALAAQAASDGKTDAVVSAGFAASDTFVKKNPELIQAWRKSIQEAVDFIANNEQQARDILQKWLGLAPDVAKSTPLPAFSATVSPGELDALIKVSLDMGQLKSPLDSQALVAK